MAGDIVDAQHEVQCAHEREVTGDVERRRARCAIVIHRGDRHAGATRVRARDRRRERRVLRELERGRARRFRVDVIGPRWSGTHHDQHQCETS
jgi:hypothetical protein